jgi:DNA-binding response OmpR family regulator
MTTILLVDDEPLVLRVLSAGCEEAGYETLTATNGAEALRVFFERRPDLVISDIRMPVMNGMELVRRIREVSNVPIIVLSAVGEEEDKVRALQFGADDFVVKPVGIREVIARVESVLRRAQQAAPQDSTVYNDGTVTIHHARQEAYVRGALMSLTPKELKLLAYLTRRADRVVSVAEILQHVWGSQHYSEESVKWHIASLRRKIEADPHEPKLISTVWGSGYRYNKPKTVSSKSA